MPAPLSAVDAVSPAFAHTKRQLFQPFRFGVWARLAIVSLLTGEFAGGGWGGGNVNIPSPRGGDEPKDFWLAANPVWDQIQAYLPWILLGVALLVALGLVFIYIGSVFRFILLDAVLNDRCRLRAGWRRWQSQGAGYFLWQIAFALILFATLAVLIGGPIYLAWRAGLFRQPDQHFALLLTGGVIMFFAFLGLMLVAAVIGLFAKDFVVPVMAIENLGVLEAWRRVLPLLGAEKAAYTGYVLMKIVLAIGSAIIFGIINIILLLILIFLLAIVGVVAVAAGAAAGLTWNLYTIGAAVLAGVAAFGALFYIMSFVATPAVVFFQSYTLQFFAGRYPPLGAVMAPPRPPAPVPTPVG